MPEPLSPVVLDTAKKKQFVALVAEKATDKRAAAQCGVPIATIRQAAKDDPWFADQWEAAKALNIGEVEDALRGKAIAGDVQAIRYFLNNRAGDDWKERVTHDVSAQHVVTVDFSRQFSEAIRGAERHAIIDVVETVEAELVSSDEYALPAVVLARDAVELPRQSGAADEAQHGDDSGPSSGAPQ